MTHASLSGCGLLSALAAKLGNRAAFRREANLALIEAALAELGKVVPLIERVPGAAGLVPPSSAQTNT